VEKDLLLALEHDPTRAEAMKAILVSRYNQQEWRIAHIYSSFCVEQFLGRRPADRYWQVDDAFYNWKILRYHLPILVKLRKKDEARECLAQLKDRVQRYANQISERDRETVDALIEKTEKEL